MRHGKGTFTFPDGEKYVGEYKDGKRHGKGTCISQDGEKYVDEYKDGKLVEQIFSTYKRTVAQDLESGRVSEEKAVFNGCGGGI